VFPRSRRDGPQLEVISLITRALCPRGISWNATHALQTAVNSRTLSWPDVSSSTHPLDV
jgi:hypothetical protein